MNKIERRFRWLYSIICVALLTVTVSSQSFAEDDGKEDQYDSMARDIEAVTKNYPSLAKRLGLSHTAGFRIPLLCMGTINASCHRAVQDQCFRDSSQFGKPTYQQCLDTANRFVL